MKRKHPDKDATPSKVCGGCGVVDVDLVQGERGDLVLEMWT